jgi:hypothetical protein
LPPPDLFLENSPEAGVVLPGGLGVLDSAGRFASKSAGFAQNDIRKEGFL